MKHVIFVVLLLAAFSADGQKKVVIEKFTNSSCGTCPNASLILKDIELRYENVIWVSHYKDNGWFDNPLTNDQTAQIWSDLSVPGNPLAMIDRIPDSNFPFFVSNDWEERIKEQLNETAIAEVFIQNVDYNKESRTITFDAKVTFSENMPSGDYRISAMIVENDVIGQEQSSYYNDVEGHPLEGRGDLIWDYEHPNVVRVMLDDAWGTEGVLPMSPQASETYTHTYNYIVPGDYNPSKMKIVTMVTQHDESNLLNREVFNADQVFLSDLGLQLTSVNTTLSELGVVIYPNPTVDKLYIESLEENAQFSIINLNGRLLKSGKLSPNNTINVSDLENGSYYLNLDMKSGSGVAQFSILR